MDLCVRECDGRWAGRSATRYVSERAEHAEWWSVSASALSCSMIGAVECCEVLEKLPLIVEALREVFARLRYEGQGHDQSLVLPSEPTAAAPPGDCTPRAGRPTRSFRPMTITPDAPSLMA